MVPLISADITGFDIVAGVIALYSDSHFRIDNGYGEMSARVIA